MPSDGIKGAIRKIGMSPRNASRSFAPNAPTGRTYSVHVKISGDYSLRAGMSCRAKIFTSSPNPMISVPVQAVLSDQLSDNGGVSMSRSEKGHTEHYVFVAVKGRAEKRVVATGVADDEFLKIKSGLKEHENVIIGPPRILNTLHNNAPVTLTAPSGSST